MSPSREPSSPFRERPLSSPISMTVTEDAPLTPIPSSPMGRNEILHTVTEERFAVSGNTQQQVAERAQQHASHESFPILSQMVDQERSLSKGRREGDKHGTIRQPADMPMSPMVQSKLVKKLHTVLILNSELQTKPQAGRTRASRHMLAIAQKAASGYQQSSPQRHNNGSRLAAAGLSPHDIALVSRLNADTERGRTMFKQSKRASSPPARILEPGFLMEREIELPMQERFILNMAPSLFSLCGHLNAVEAQF